jgi:hypothetical protein
MMVTKWGALVCVLASQAACEPLEQWRAGRDAGKLALSLEAPETLDWGETGTIRLGLQNQGSSMTDGAVVEVHLPSWLEFGSVEPAGTEVTLLAGTDGTRLSYRLTAALEPGERREIVQHVRVPEDATGSSPAPADRLMRARLVSQQGAAMGAEVQAMLSFRGAVDGVGGLAAGEEGARALVRDDGVGGVRLGMTVDELRRDVPGARDTTLVLPGGGEERAVLVPVGTRAIAAIVSARGVEQIMVRDTGFSTERGLGVGSSLGELRAAYGSECAAPFGSGRIAVWFASAPGVTFAVSRAGVADTAQLRRNPGLLPDSARVTELWVGERRAAC